MDNLYENHQLKFQELEEARMSLSYQYLGSLVHFCDEGSSKKLDPRGTPKENKRKPNPPLGLG